MRKDKRNPRTKRNATSNVVMRLTPEEHLLLLAFKKASVHITCPVGAVENARGFKNLVSELGFMYANSLILGSDSLDAQHFADHSMIRCLFHFFKRMEEELIEAA